MVLIPFGRALPLSPARLRCGLGVVPRRTAASSAGRSLATSATGGLGWDFDAVVDRTQTDSLKWGRRYHGRDIIPLWVADMDFRVAPPIMDAILERANHGIFGYALPPVTTTDAVLAYLSRLGAMPPGVELSSSNIVFLPNVISGLSLATNFAGHGESVLTTTPVYPPFLSKPEGEGRQVVDVPLVLKHHNRHGASNLDATWSIDFEAMEARITPCTRVFMLCNPHNPIGKVYSRHELEELHAFCKKHDLIVCSDEVHCDLVFADTPQPHVPFASLNEDAASRTITLHAANKAYNVPALGCAYAVASDPKILARFKELFARDYSAGDVGIFGYAALEAAYNHPDSRAWQIECMSYLQANRDLVHSFVQENMDPAHVSLFHPPQATYLTWVDGRGLGLGSSASLVHHFKNFGVEFSPGKPFGGPDNDGFFRINFGCPRSTLMQGLDRMLLGYTAAVQSKSEAKSDDG